MVIDAGDHEYGEMLTEYLQSIPVAAIQHAVITHPHKNHFGGFDHLIKRLPIEHIYVNGDETAEPGYRDLISSVQERRVPVSVLKRGDTISNLPRGISMEVMHPGQLDNSPNNNSLVLWLRHGEVSMLFMGDIEESAQEELFRYAPHVQKVKIVKVPHHGGTIGKEFGDFFSGAEFIISTGKNPYHYPKAEDLKRLPGNVYRTDEIGTIIVESDGKEVTISTSTSDRMNDESG